MPTSERERPAPPGPATVRWLRSPVVIGATVLAAAGVGLAQHSTVASVLRGLLVVVVVPCALIDVERRLIPNRITGPAALLGLAAGLALDAAGEPRRLLWAAIAGGFLLIASLVNPAGMGMGDVKLLGVLGLYLGPAVVLALLVALVASLAFGVVIAARRGVRAARKTTLPFGPYLALGGIVAALAGDRFVHALLHLR